MKVLHLYWVSGYASSHSKMCKWMWMMQHMWSIIQQAICHSMLLLGFVCLARTYQNKDNPPRDGKLPWASACCCISPVAFDWGSDCCWLGYCRSLWLSWDHRSTQRHTPRHRSLSLGQILYHFKWYITILTPKSGEVINQVMYPR